MKPQKKRRFSIEKLEERITPDLTLPSGGMVFANFDNPAPGTYHPNFYRSGTAIETTSGLAGTNPTIVNVPYGNEGPWSAHYLSDQIDCTAC
jgi:hypothetical protein